MKGVAIGCGAISEFHFKGWQRVSGAEIVAVCDVREEMARRRADEFGIPGVYSSYSAMFDAEKPDFVDVITRPESHREIVLEAIGGRIPVICQKPFAASLAEAQEMVQAAAQAGVPLMVHENWRWRRWYRQIKQWIDQGLLGTPRYAHFSFHSDAVLPDYGLGISWSLQRYPYQVKMPKLILYEFGIHLVDIFRFLFGEPIRLYGVSRRRSPLVQGEDHVVLILETEELMATIDLSWASWGRRSNVVLEEISIEGDQGYIAMDAESKLRLESAHHSQSLGPYASQYPEFYVESFSQTEQHFCNCLREGSDFETSGRDNLKTLGITLKTYQSLTESVPVKLDQP
jgi:predicted dehydrogenase